MSVCVGLIVYGPYWLFSFLHMRRCYNADTADLTLWPPNPYDTFLLISSSSLHLRSARGYFQQLEYKTALRDLQISHWSRDYDLVSLHPHPGHSSEMEWGAQMQRASQWQRIPSTCACLQKARCWPLVPSAPPGTPSDARSSWIGC